VLCAGSTFLLVKSYTPTSFLAALSGVSQSLRASTFGSLVLSPTGSINLGFTTEGRLAVVVIITFSWGFQQVFWCQQRASQTAIKLSGAVAREKEDFCKGSLSLPIFFFVIVLLYFIFACTVLSKIQKKIVSLIVGIPLPLLLVHYVVS
jgi:hypothetical protein